MEQRGNENFTEENAKKKEYLYGYRSHVRRISRIEAELEEIRSMKTSPSVNNDGMPHGSSQSDLSDYASNLDELESELLKERHQRILTYKDISERIKHLRSENEKDVMFYRYIKGLEWWEIAERMKFSERQVFRFHGRALAHINIPAEILKDVSECQSNM